MILFSGFILGLFGSIHCLGMCGPIALMIPLKSNSIKHRLIGSSFYNFGRILTYSIFGALFGLLGNGLVLAGFQQWVSIIIGLLIILLVLIPQFTKFIGLQKKEIIPTSALKKALRNRFGSSNNFSLFSIGLLNGLLPCGMVYLAIVGAITTGSWEKGALYMGLFGLGTFPIMATLPLIGSLLKISFKEKIKKAYPIVMLLFGVLFLLRGLNLDIPYISPKMSEEKPEAHCCH